LPRGEGTDNVPGVRMTLQPPADFEFRSAVCSHGFFVLAPNRWDPASQTLNTVITLDDENAIPIAIRASAHGHVAVRSPARLIRSRSAGVRRAVSRMLRLDEDLSRFHDRCRRCASHAEAAALRFGRLLRGASLFEDVVKVLCTCNVAWRQTVAMVDRIVRHWGVPAGAAGVNGFPTPSGLARVRVSALKRLTRVGYRAEFIHEFARSVASGRLDLAQLEQSEAGSEELYTRLRRIRGVGDYAASHLCMLLGYYDRLAIDTEMVRLLTQRHPRRRFTPASIRAYYQPWQPYAFLAYWYELWADYVDRHGRAEQWSPMGVGREITSRKPLRQ